MKEKTFTDTGPTGRYYSEIWDIAEVDHVRKDVIVRKGGLMSL
jgi:hypothetical protein